MEWHHQWKSTPSCPTEVVARTNGQNGELNAALTSESRASSLLYCVLPYRKAYRLWKRDTLVVKVIDVGSSVHRLPQGPWRARAP